jgi:hypothetical protein
MSYYYVHRSSFKQILFGSGTKKNYQYFCLLAGIWPAMQPGGHVMKMNAAREGVLSALENEACLRRALIIDHYITVSHVPAN